jgi:hypothetical protein
MTLDLQAYNDSLLLHNGLINQNKFSKEIYNDIKFDGTKGDWINKFYDELDKYDYSKGLTTAKKNLTKLNSEYALLLQK